MRILSLGSKRQACFFSALNPQESSTRQRTNDWKGVSDELRMVLYNHSNRPGHDCIYQPNLPHAQNDNLLFHQCSSDAFFCTTICRLAHKVVTFAGEAEAILGKRTDLRMWYLDRRGRFSFPQHDDQEGAEVDQGSVWTKKKKERSWSKCIASEVVFQPLLPDTGWRSVARVARCRMREEASLHLEFYQRDVTDERCHLGNFLSMWCQRAFRRRSKLCRNPRTQRSLLLGIVSTHLHGGRR